MLKICDIQPLAGILWREGILDANSLTLLKSVKERSLLHDKWIVPVQKRESKYNYILAPYREQFAIKANLELGSLNINWDLTKYSSDVIKQLQKWHGTENDQKEGFFRFARNYVTQTFWALATLESDDWLIITINFCFASPFWSGNRVNDLCFQKNHCQIAFTYGFIFN